MEEKNDLTEIIPENIQKNGQEAAREEPRQIPEEDMNQAEPEQIPEEEPEEEKVSEAPTYRKPSPFADSPYEMHRELQEPSAPQKKIRHSFIKNWTAVLVLVLAASILSSGVTSLIVEGNCRKQLKAMELAVEQKLAVLEGTNPEKPAVPAIPAEPAEGMTPGQIYNAHAGAVVSVICTIVETDPSGQEMVGESAGSGFVVSQDGYIVTNCHVIEGADSVQVRDHDANVYDAKIIGKDAGNDVALLKVEGENMQTVEIGNCQDLSVGDRVVVIGHPLGNQDAILTVGYVSAKNQVVRTDGNSSSQDMIQTDAAINAGNSGGPLFDSMGRVIGITTAKFSGYSSSGASIEGVGYAIPMDDVVPILEELKEFGKVKHSYLGVMVKDVDQAAQEYGIPAGAFLDEVVDDLAADQAGMQEKDVIVEMGGYEVGSVADLTRVLRKFKTGEEVSVKLWRNGEYVYLSVILMEKPQEEETPEPTQGGTMPQMPSDMPDNWFDFFEHFFGF